MLNVIYVDNIILMDTIFRTTAGVIFHSNGKTSFFSYYFVVLITFPNKNIIMCIMLLYINLKKDML